jgi:hypothetical protein
LEETMADCSALIEEESQGFHSCLVCIFKVDDEKHRQRHFYSENEKDLFFTCPLIEY